MSEPGAIEAWDLGPVTVQRHGTGLINATWAVHGDRPSVSGPIGFLQRLNTAIFVPEVHEDIEAVTAHLADKGMTTPRLVRTRAGGLWHTGPDGGVWRLLTPTGDRTIDKIAAIGDARSAGALVARFHAAVTDLRWDFRSVRPGAHDTDAHMARLSSALSDHADHPLFDRVAPLADRILAGWRAWDGPRELPLRIIHGDLKISNVRFQGPDAVALIDLDTLAWGTLDVELGDAMRSWCNPATEDAGEARFDLDIFAAAMAGYRSAADGVTAEEWDAIVPGIERICWELAARFAADALAESYFGWDPSRYPSRGAHNLARAAGQASLAASVRTQRSAAEAALRG